MLHTLVTRYTRRNKSESPPNIIMQTREMRLCVCDRLGFLGYPYSLGERCDNA